MELNLAAFVRVTAAVLLTAVAAKNPLIIYDENIHSYEQVKGKHSQDHPDALIKSYTEVKGISLSHDDHPNYSKITILSGASLPLKPIAILRYLEAGGTLLWSVDGDSLDGESENLLQQFGLRSVGVVTDKHAKSATANFNTQHAISKTLNKLSVNFKGVGFAIIKDSDRHNELIQPLLMAEESARCEGDDKVFGDQIVLAATMDTRVGGRVFICNESLMREKRLFAAAQKWTNKNLGVIRLDSFDHYQGNTENSEWYVVNGNFGITACMSEYHPNTDSFVPVQPTDVQVELKLQHTRQRVTLIPSKRDKCLHAEMKVPDVYGRYTLLLDYNRPGLPLIQKRHLINVRPQWLDQIPKFVMAALPYYVGWQLQLLITCAMIVPLLWNATRPTSLKNVGK